MKTPPLKMRTTFWIGLGLLLAVPMLAMAADKSKTKRCNCPCHRQAVVKPAKTSSAQVYAGSLIPRETRINGLITDSQNHLVVVDQETIRRSGAADLRELLVRRGLHR